MNKNKSLPFVIGAIVVLFSVGVVFLQHNNKVLTTNYPSPDQSTVTTTPTATTSSTYTLADVAKHKNQADCWTTINGGVYNVTPWISQHPGGAEAILSLCGIDGSSAFNAQHGGERRPASELASFKIGTLK
jgi:cytochrome b involved in lipid metabolism